MKEPTHNEIAKQLNITRQAVSAWYRKKSLPTIANVVKLSKIYNESIEKTIARFINVDN